MHENCKKSNLLRSMKLKLWNTIKEKKTPKKYNYAKKYVVLRTFFFYLFEVIYNIIYNYTCS